MGYKIVNVDPKNKLMLIESSGKHRWAGQYNISSPLLAEYLSKQKDFELILEKRFVCSYDECQKLFSVCYATPNRDNAAFVSDWYPTRIEGASKRVWLSFKQ